MSMMQTTLRLSWISYDHEYDNNTYLLPTWHDNLVKRSNAPASGAGLIRR